MSEKEYMSAKVDPNSPLYQQFQKVIEQEGYESNSEAVRALVRDGINIRDGLDDDPLDERPDGYLAALFWQARGDIHTFVLVAVVSLLVSVLATSVLLSVAAQLVALAYAAVVLLVALDTVILGDRLLLRLIDFSDRVTVEVDR